MCEYITTEERLTNLSEVPLTCLTIFARPIAIAIEGSTYKHNLCAKCFLHVSCVLPRGHNIREYPTAVWPIKNECVKYFRLL